MLEGLDPELVVVLSLGLVRVVVVVAGDEVPESPVDERVGEL